MNLKKDIFHSGLLIDLDGTILNKNDYISAKVIFDLKKLKDIMPISIVTGRGPQDVLKFSKLLNFYGPQYGENGSSAIDGQSGELIYKNLINYKSCEIILNEISFANFDYLVVSNGNTFVNPSENLNNISSIVVSSKREEDLDHFNSKIGILEGTLSQKSIDENGNNFLNYHNEFSGKDKSLKHFINFYNLNEKKTFVIGDGLNDMSMIKSCKNSIAMGNASNKIKKHARFITKSINEDGVSYALKKFIYPLI